MSSSPKVHFRQSGGVSVAELLLMVVIGALSAVLIGGGYGFLARHNPVTYMNIPLYVAFAMTMLLAMYGTVKISRMHVPWLAGSLALIFAMLGVYAAWLVWLYEYGLRTPGGAAILRPDDLIETARAIATAGGWSIHGYAPPAYALYSLWAAEAILVAGVCAKVASVRAAHPVCDTCRSWMKSVYEELVLARPLDVGAMRSRLEQGDYQMLAVLPPPEGSVYISLDLLQCAKCKKVGYLTIENYRVVSDDRGRTVTVSSPLITNMRLNGASLDQARRLAVSKPIFPTDEQSPTGVARW